MKRDLSKLSSKWDVIIVGGGASGLGTAVDSASRGFKTLLLEQHDFAKGTSSRSTKLVHGGVRYLAQGDVSLVLEALQERGLLKKNAPHLVKDLSFLIPSYTWWDGPFYTLGMKVYDKMAGHLGLGPSEHIGCEEAISAIPNLSEEGLKGGVIYRDGQFDDARLAINLAQTAVELGACVLNYMKVTSLRKDGDGFICGLEVCDEETGEKHTIRGGCVVNACGVFADGLLKMDNPKHEKTIAPSQGVHIVLDKKFLQSDHAIMIPKTSDGRVLFAVPWHDCVIVGTTDTPVDEPKLEPRALQEEVDFILKTASEYLVKDPKEEDILSVFAGLRPLAAPKSGSEKTKEISRGHKVMVSHSGLVSVIGGKWTTYRKMAEDIVNQACSLLGVEHRNCVTKDLKIHGYDLSEDCNYYGSDQKELENLSGSGVQLHKNFDIYESQVRWAVQNEMARSVEDFLARRSRVLLFDAKTSMKMAPRVAEIMAEELGVKNPSKWVKNQVEVYRNLASGYIWRKV